MSPELAQLLAELKISPGTKFEAAVTAITTIEEQDQAQLRQHKEQTATPGEKRTWQSLLSQPVLKLVELRYQGTVFAAITDIPAKVGQTLTVAVSVRGVQVFTLSSAVGALAAPRSATVALDSSTAAGPNQAPSLPRELARVLAFTTAPVIPPNSAQVRTPALDIPSGRANAEPALVLALGSRLQASTNNEPKGPAVQAIATALAKALPRATAAADLLATNGKLLSLLREIPLASLPQTLRPLVPLLSALQRQSLAVTSHTPLKAETIANAINSSGVFHERNSIGAVLRGGEIAPQEEEADLKALLIRVIDQLTQLSVASSSGPAIKSANAGNDAVARLWLGLVNALPGKVQFEKRTVSDKENLLQVAQNLAHGTLAKIQLNQYRSLGSGAAETAQGGPQLHLDLPLKWPDAYGNAHLQIFPPREREEKQAQREKRKATKNGRWRIFMELEMGDDGSLAVELTVAEKSVGATFWAEKEQLRDKAATALQQLQRDLVAQGLQVSDLRCSQNPPPKQKIHLDYALIDVRT